MIRPNFLIKGYNLEVIFTSENYQSPHILSFGFVVARQQKNE